MIPLSVKLLGRRFHVACAVALTALLIGHELSTSVAVGSVVGQVWQTDLDRNLGGASVYLSSIVGPDHSRGQESRPDGSFRFARVPAGSYLVNASSRAHSVDSVFVSVEEGRATTVRLAVSRTEPELRVANYQGVFTRSENAAIPIRGYLATLPGGRAAPLRVRILKTRLTDVLRDAARADELRSVTSSYEQPSSLPAELEEPSTGPKPKRVIDRNQPVEGAGRDGFFHQWVQLGKLAPGLYLVELWHGDASTVTAFQVTDLALVTKEDVFKGVAFVVDIVTGRAVSGASVYELLPGGLLPMARTGSDGTCGLQESASILVAKHGENEAVSGLSNGNYGNYQRFLTVHTIADRPIYRPGHRIEFKSVVRRVVERGSRYSVLASEKVTAELVDPSGERMETLHLTTNVHGSVAGGFDLSAEAPTGTYTISIDVLEEVFAKDVVVAAYRKPEFSAEAEPGKRAYIRGEIAEFRVSAEYYFGAPVVGAKVEYSVYREVDWASEFEGDPDFEEEDYAPDYERYGEAAYGKLAAEGEGVLDDQGALLVRVPANLPDGEELPSAHRLMLSATITDPAGRETTAEAQARLYPGDLRLSLSPAGYLVEPGKPFDVRVLAKRFDGGAAAGVRVELVAEQEEWKRGSYVRQPAGTATSVTDASGQTSIQVAPTRRGDIRLTVKSRDSAGRQVSAATNVWCVSDAGGDIEAEYADLSVSTDKKRYNPGDLARVLVNADITGQTALLTVEGGGIHSWQTFAVRQRSTVLRVPVREEYGPNVFLSVCYVKNKAFATSEAQLRVNMPRKEIRVSLAPDRSSASGLPRYGPRDTVRFAVRTTDSKGTPVACELALGVVDEAIYALRKDDPSAIREAFYPRRYNEVHTSYSFDSTFLGQGDKAEPKIVARKKFKDTAYWNPFVRTDKLGQAAVSFVLPDNLTTWRATAIACSGATQVGWQTSKVLCSKDFLVRLEMPRLLTDRDEVRLLAVVHNETSVARRAFVRLTAPGFETSGAIVREVEVPPHGTASAEWPGRPRQRGKMLVRVAAWTEGGPGLPELNDAVEVPLRVRTHGRTTVDVVSGEVSREGPQREGLRLEEGFAPEETSLVVRVSPQVAASFAESLEYLAGYPYGCTEQTLSRFVPDLIAQRVARELDAMRDLVPASLRKGLPAMLRDGLQRLYRLQHWSGGWGWWESDGDDAWMTAYALQGLAEARQAGAPVRRSALDKAIEAALKLALSASPDDRAFLLASVARSGKAQAALTESLNMPLRKLGPEGWAHLMTVRRLGGDKPGAAQARSELGRLSRRDGARIHWGDREGSWSEPVRETSVALRALAELNAEDPLALGAVRWLMARRTGHFWQSTRDTALALAALGAVLAGNAALAQPGGPVVVRLNGRELSAPSTAREGDQVYRVPGAELVAGKHNVEIAFAEGGGLAFYSAELRRVVPSDSIGESASQGLRVRRDYLRVLPQRLEEESWDFRTEKTHNRMRQGDRIRVRLTIDVPQDLSFVLFEDPFPAGLEVTARGTADEEGESSYWWDHVDVRDERIACFARSLPKGRHEFEYHLKAQTPGVYRAMPALVQPMYSPGLKAESAADRIEVAPAEPIR